MLPNPAIREVNLSDYLKIVRKRIGLILAFLIIIPTIVTIYDFTRTPVYRSVASLLVEQATPRITKFEDVYQAPYVGEMQYFYQTQYKILESMALVERVFDELRLSKDLDYRGLKDPLLALKKQIKIEPVRNSQIILVSVEDRDPLRASVIANTLVKLYIQQDIEMKNRAAKEATGWLESQLTDLKKKLQASEESLNSYMQKNKIVTVPDVEKKTQTLLESLKESRNKLETDIAEASKRYKAKHPKMIALRAQLDDTRIKIDQETNSLLDLNQKMVQYNMLKKEADSIQALYSSLLSRAKETDISEKISASSIRLIDTAKPEDTPFKPKKLRDILFSFVVAFVLGFGLAFFLEHLDSSIRTSEDVTMYLNLPFLGYIPSLDKDSKPGANKSLVCFNEPASKITESFRAVRTSILFASPEDRPLKTILITSSIPQEGKSFISTNLSEVFCQVKEKVILIDIDMRRPKIHKELNIAQQPGLSNYLTGNADIASIIKPTVMPNLFVVPSGVIPPNPSELLSSDKILSLLEELKNRFDHIVIDSPPILSAADTSLLANIVDGVILVIKGSTVRMEAALQAKERILKAKGKIIGAIINNIQPEKEDSYYYHYYYSEEAKNMKKR